MSGDLILSSCLPEHWANTWCAVKRGGRTELSKLKGLILFGMALLLSVLLYWGKSGVVSAGDRMLRSEDNSVKSLLLLCVGSRESSLGQAFFFTSWTILLALGTFIFSN